MSDLTRAQLIDLIPKRYNHRLHLVMPTLTAAAIGVVAVIWAGDFSWIDLLWVAVTFVIANGVEWFAHKHVLHRPRPLLREIYVRHELHHHQLYTHRSMEFGSPRELWMILVPAYALVVVVASVLPFAGLAWLLVGRSAAATVVLTAQLYFIVYEWLHLAYHLPSSHWVSRLPLMKRLRQLHRSHHNPRLMQTHNFNVTIGLFDWIMGTLDTSTPACVELPTEPSAAGESSGPMASPMATGPMATGPMATGETG